MALCRSRASLEDLLRRCVSGDENAQLAATKECRKLLSDHKPPIGTLVEMGLVPIFVQFLTTSTNPKLQFEAAWVLTNICSGSSEQTWAVVESGDEREEIWRRSEGERRRREKRTYSRIYELS